MRLLYDQNLSYRLVGRLSALYPDSVHVRQVGLGDADDIQIRAYAAAEGLAIVSKDADFYELSLRLGHPPKAEKVPAVILPKDRDPRFVTIRRGGSLTDSDHRLLALWAAACAEHVLDFFESARPEDPRPRQAIEQARAWVRGEVTMAQSRTSAGHAMGAARDLRGAARHAAYAAGQAAAVAHVAAHDLGAAAYAIKAVRAAAPEGAGESAGRAECRWQRDQLPEAIRALVLDDQRLRNDICWSVFDQAS